MSFNTVCQPETSPHKIMSAGKPFQMSVAVASQLVIGVSARFHIGAKLIPTEISNLSKEKNERFSCFS